MEIFEIRRVPVIIDRVQEAIAFLVLCDKVNSTLWSELVLSNTDPRLLSFQVLFRVKNKIK